MLNWFYKLSDTHKTLVAATGLVTLGWMSASAFQAQRAMPAKLEAQTLTIKANTVRIEGAEARLDTLEQKTRSQNEKLDHITRIVCIPLSRLQKTLAGCE